MLEKQPSQNSAARAPRRNVLPPNLAPRGLNRLEAAAYVGVGPTLFDAMVKDRRMPHPKHINGRRVWDRLRLDIAFEALPDENSGDDDPWSRLAA